MSVLQTEVCIVGAGPAGCTLSLFLAKHEIPHVLVDKATFPRDKICGDGLTLEVMHTLSQIDPQLLSAFLESPEFQPCWKVQAQAPNGRIFTLPFDSGVHPYAPLYTGRRKEFDHFLWKNLEGKMTKRISPAKVVNISREGAYCYVYSKTPNKEIQKICCSLVIGADGSSSIVRRFLGNMDLPPLPGNMGLGIRAYGRQKSRERKMEFIFLKELLPGYFWVFPLANGGVNVGVYLSANKLKAKNYHLPSLLKKCISQYNESVPETDQIQDLGKPYTWALPVCRQFQSLGGANYLLLGDAASLIEPFTGKGIGMAMLSAKVAGQTIIQGKANQNDLSQLYLQYEKAIKRMYSREYAASNFLAKLFSLSLGANMAVWLFSRKALKSYVHENFQKEIIKWQC